jgi:hypothetical protein
MWPHPNAGDTAVIQGLNALSVYHNVHTMQSYNGQQPPTCTHWVTVAGRRVQVTAEGTARWGFDDRIYTAEYDNGALARELQQRETEIKQ